MQPFQITCTTCHARLRVESAEAVGQILACPKCASMVQVVPPAGWQEGTSPPDAVGSAAEQPADGVSPPEMAVPATLGTDAATAVPAPTPPTPPSTPADAPAAPPVATAPPVAAAEQPPLRPVWASPQERMWHNLVVTGAAGGLGLLLLGSVAGYLILRRDAPPVAEIAAEETAVSSAPADEDAAPSAGTDPPADAVARHDTPPADADPQEIPPAPPAEPDLPAVNPPETAPSDAPPDPSTAPPSAPTTAPPRPEVEPPAVPAPPAVPPPTTEPPPEVRPTPQVVREPRDPHASPPDVDTQLALPLGHFAVNGMPLADLAAQLTELTAVPFTLDLPALRGAGLSPRTRLTLSTDDSTVASLLEAALAPHNLTSVATDGHVAITTPAAAAGQRSVRYRVDDLAGPDQLPDLAAQLQRLVAPASWGGAGGSCDVADGALVVQQTAAVHGEIIEFCEKLRTVRGLPLRGRFPAARFAPTSRRARAAEMLAAPAGGTFREPTRLVDVVRVLQESSGGHILLDWRSLAAEDLAPDSRISCTLRRQPLAATLDALLAPLDSTWRAVDATTIEVYSTRDEATRMRAEFFPAADAIEAGHSREQIEAAVRRACGDAEWGEGTALAWDEPAGCLIVRQTQPVQADVERAIAALAPAKGAAAPQR